MRSRRRASRSALSSKLGHFRHDGGNVAVITALLLVPIIGVVAMGVEASSWFVMGRAAQNAADSAAVAAANNASVYGGTKTEWQAEGKATARRYGFTDGSNNVTVTLDTADVTSESCPDGATTKCFKATVTKKLPIYLAAVVGYRGNTTIGTKNAVLITSSAYAEPVNGIKYPTCLTVTGRGGGGTGPGIDTRGAPFSNMKGCSISSTDPSGAPVACTGQGIGGNPSIFATGSIDPRCTGGNTLANGPTNVYSDPYKDYYKKITCGVNSGELSPTCTSGTTPSTCSGFNNAALATGACIYSGTTINLSGANTLNPANPSVMYVKNGSINLNDNATLTASNVTFVFTGSTPGSFTGGKKGAVDITAPSSGTWSGVAAYQDTHLAASAYVAPSWASTGNTPNVDIVGLMYLPRTDVDFGGGAGEPLKTSTCYIAVYHSYYVNGTGISMSRSGCTAAGLGTLPTVTILRAALVK